MENQADVTYLVEEYRLIFGESLPSAIREADDTKIEQVLVREGDWSSHAAIHLVSLASRYGSFVLRNALAVALALEIEDGELGF